AGLIALDTMRDYIIGHGRQLWALLAEVDLLFLNGPELTALVGGDPSRLLGRGRLRALVVKEGAEGARLITAEGDWWVAPPAVRRVVDPTGAGDALAGGMLGRLAELRRTDPEALLEALAEGTLAAGAAIEAFGPKGLLAGREEGSVPL
ncbi:MAG: PfkB family carbohydrate kinase, partial [Candidatus Dormiibacterota bacterium]